MYMISGFQPTLFYTNCFNQILLLLSLFKKDMLENRYLESYKPYENISVLSLNQEKTCHLHAEHTIGLAETLYIYRLI